MSPLHLLCNKQRHPPIPSLSPSWAPLEEAHRMLRAKRREKRRKRRIIKVNRVMQVATWTTFVLCRRLNCVTQSWKLEGFYSNEWRAQLHENFLCSFSSFHPAVIILLNAFMSTPTSSRLTLTHKSYKCHQKLTYTRYASQLCSNCQHKAAQRKHRVLVGDARERVV